MIIEMLSNVNLATDLQLLSCAGRVMVSIFLSLTLVCAFSNPIPRS